MGTFYTPGDVARSLAANVIAPTTERLLDPACGAGVFLRAAFTELATAFPSDHAIRCIYGIDVDATALDACALVLTHDWLVRQPLSGHESPEHRFAAVRAQLFCADALELFAFSSQVELFDSATEPVAGPLPTSFDAVLMNPPFAPSGEVSENTRLGYASLRAARNPSGVNLVWPFWELAARATSLRGRAGTVLPLSVAYLNNAVARAARSEVFSRGSWDLQFFDRTPDALFGDDIKQRVALAVKRPGPEGFVRTTTMRRWSADRRAVALRLEPGEGVRLRAQSEQILKIGSAHERQALASLRSADEVLGDAADRVRLVLPRDLDDTDRAMAVAPTAYNWIGGFRRTAVAAEARRHAAGKLSELTFSSPAVADAAYAVITSRVFLWWWRATGDFFHVPLSALTRAPFPLGSCAELGLARLAEAGRECWAAALEAPTVAVNRGVTTLAHAPTADSPTLDVADRAVGNAFGLSRKFVRFVREDAIRLRAAGRSS